MPKNISNLKQRYPQLDDFVAKSIVIKYGGNAMTDNTLKNHFAQDVVLLKQMGLNPVIIHGGGPQISQMLQRVGKESQFIDGMRVTDSETMEIVSMVLGATVNQEIVRLIQKNGAKAVGLTGFDGKLIQAKKLTSVDLGHVGEVVNVKPELINLLINQQYIPIIAPMGTDDNGVVYNINADLVAGAIAASLKAAKLIMLTNTAGILDKDNNLIAKLDADLVFQLIEDGTINSGMLPKINTALDAVTAGVNAVNIIDGREKHAILRSFSDNNNGSVIV